MLGFLDISLFDLSENLFPISSSQGEFFNYHDNLYIVYVEEDKKIRIKTGVHIYNIYDGSKNIIINDTYLDINSNLLYISGIYDSQGFYVIYNIQSFTFSSIELISESNNVSRIFIINNILHYIYSTHESIILSKISSGVLTSVNILNNLTPQKNAYVAEHLYSNGKLYIFVQQEDENNNYLNLRVFYGTYDGNTNYNPLNFLLNTNNKHTLFSSISVIDGSECLLTIEDDFISIDVSQNIQLQANKLSIYSINNTFITNPTPYRTFSLSGISIISLKNIVYNDYNHLIGFGYQTNYENPKYLIVQLDNNPQNPVFTTLSNSNGYISTNNFVDIISFQNRVYMYLEQIQDGTHMVMISNLGYTVRNTIINQYIYPPQLITLPNESTFNFLDPVVGEDISSAIYFGETPQLELGDLFLPGPRVSIRNNNNNNNMKFVFGSIQEEEKN